MVDEIARRTIAHLEKENQRLRGMLSERDHAEAQKIEAIRQEEMKIRDDENAEQRDRMYRAAAKNFRKSDWTAWLVVNSPESAPETIVATLDQKVAEKMATPDLWAPGHSIADWSASLDDLRQIEPAPAIGQGETFMEKLLNNMGDSNAKH